MCRGVHEDVIRESAQLLSRGQLAVDQQEGHLEERRLLGQLLYPISPILEHSPCAVDVTYPRSAANGILVAWVIDPQRLLAGVGDLRQIFR